MPARTILGGRCISRSSAPRLEAEEVIEQVVDRHAPVGRAGGRAVIDVGGDGALLKDVEVIEQVVDGDPAIGSARARAVVHVGDACEPLRPEQGFRAVAVRVEDLS